MIQAQLLSTPPEFSVELALLRTKYTRHGVPISITEKTIEVKKTKACGLVEIHSIKSRPITVAGNDSENDDANILDIVAEADDYTTDDVDTHEQLTKIRQSLPNGARQVFDILANIGVTWDEYSKQYGEGKIRIAHLAKFLGVGSKQIVQWQTVIRHQMGVFQLVPADLAAIG